MTWFFLSLLTAMSVAVRDVSVKIFKDLEPPQIAGIELLWSMPLLACGLFLIPVPHLDTTFAWTFLISLPLNALAYILYLYAIKLSPLSLSVPFLSFTPVFMLITGYLTLGERVNLWGAGGVIFIVVGSYVLNIDKAQNGLWRPFSSFFKEKGSWLMMIVAFLFSFAAVIGKKSMQHSSPLFFTFSFFLTFNLLFILSLFLTGKMQFGNIVANRKKGCWLGGLLVLHVCCHALAIINATAVYMIAVKRSSILFSMLFSWLVLKESEMIHRGIGSCMMFAGFLLITLYG